MDLKKLENKKIVCLGGGIGTVNLIRGLHAYTKHITVVVSMADEGGSSGRLRRMFETMPPGDIVSCMSALIKDEKQKVLFEKFLTYRFPGDRYGKDKDLGGHKIGNLMMYAGLEVTGSFAGAIDFMKQLFGVEGDILPATEEPVTIDARTVDGLIVQGEERIDLGKYKGKRVLDHVYLHPRNAKVTQQVIQALQEADAVIVGPGDLYTTLLPVLIVPEITQTLLHLQKTKIFVVNVANKPFETKGYRVDDFINAIEKHVGAFPFDKIIVNNNFSLPIPNSYHYSYVTYDSERLEQMKAPLSVIADDLVDEDFPLYHNSKKLASLVAKNI